ncbi:hypothetical protein AAG570_005456, partial [Ranatra chinensis]
CFRWKGSIYKLVWPDLFAFLTLYYSLNFTYRYAMDADQRAIFEAVSIYCDTYSNYIPLSFVLGFYISIIMQRWWDQYSSIPWPDPIAVFVSSHIHGQDERGRLMRRTIMRYVCLCLTMVFSMICPRVKKRFPKLDHFVEAGLLLDNEKSIIMDLNEKFPRHSKHWLPIVWAASIVTRARKEGRIRDDFAVKTIIDELNKFRGQCGLLLNYDSISVPLVYTQVVTLATYSFFITSAIGRQWLDIADAKRRNPIDLYFPVFSTLQFFFYMGWLKVAESLINPFGEDDDDFEINWIVDRNVTVSYLIVDEMHHEHPELIRDQYWDEVFPTELPHTVASQPFKEKIPQPSTANIAVSNSDAEYFNPTAVKVEDVSLGEDAVSGIHFSVGRSASRMSMSGRPRTFSGGSSTSVNNLGSTSTSLHRVGSVTSVLKRILFNRSESNVGTPAVDGRMPESQSSTSLATKVATGGSLRIADQVIEEVDEQQTITSMAGKPPEQRPTAQSIFQDQQKRESAKEKPPQVSTAHSMPVNPTSLPPTMPVSPTRSTATEVFSMHSAPAFNDNSSGLGSGSICPGDHADTVSIGSSTTVEDEEEDEFAKLKHARQKEMERIMLARSISAIAEGRMSPSEDIALLDLTTDSKAQLISRKSSASRK